MALTLYVEHCLSCSILLISYVDLVCYFHRALMCFASTRQWATKTDGEQEYGNSKAEINLTSMAKHSWVLQKATHRASQATAAARLLSPRNGCLRPSTAQVYVVNHKCTHEAVVETQVIAITSRLQPLACVTQLNAIWRVVFTSTPYTCSYHTLVEVLI